MKCPHCGKKFNLRDAVIRSTPQNKYMWGVVIEILSDELGYSKFEIHEILKEMFLREPKYIKTIDNKVKEVWISRSTRELTTEQFEKYMADVRNWAVMDLGIVLPLPREQLENENND